MNLIQNCEVCGQKALHRALDLGDHPMCDDLVPVGDPRIPIEYPIQISFCPVCRTAHQMFQIPKRTLFSESYHYRARHTADVLKGMATLVDRCEELAGSVKDLTVLDVGCNDGSLLSIFRQKGAKTIGVEPTGAASDAIAAGHTVYHDYFSPEIATKIVAEHGKPDIVTFTNVFAHIENLESVITALRTLMGPQTLLVIENHYLGAVLDRYQFDTFYHEHPRTYSLTSFDYIARSLGASLVSVEFPARYGGNIRVVMAGTPRKNVGGLAPHEVDESDFGERLAEMGRRIPLWSKGKRAELLEVVSRFGPLPAKAFPGRAAILVKLLGLDETMVSAIYEKPGSMKIDHYVPGTRIPIVSDDDFADRPNKEAPLLNFAWHIADEIHAYLRSRGYAGEIIDLFSAEEFDRLTASHVSGG
ncbi:MULTISPECIES: class I SAM-dependent methyltransferase [Mesorhizobium]|uniref:class I SAM-dependent methyltransferase n=1 Tax=Mesorhizobium TaxID=68287 RepID=UPI001FDFC893|nr:MULTISPECIES: class I SAM-dependent methyltransferase [Mesorhizobium]